MDMAEPVVRQPPEVDQQQLRGLLGDLLLATGMDPNIGYVRQIDAVRNPPDPVFQATAFLQRRHWWDDDGFGMVPAVFYMWFGLLASQLLRHWNGQSQVMYLGLLVLAVIVFLIERRQQRRFRERLRAGGLAEFWLDLVTHRAKDLELITRYAPWPWGRVFLGRPPRTQRQRILLLSYNFAWYLAPPRLYLRWEWVCYALALALLLPLGAALAAGHSITSIGVLPLAPLFLILQLVYPARRYMLVGGYMIKHIHGLLTQAGTGDVQSDTGSP